jgi:CheY-like chemotaxis protein
VAPWFSNRRAHRTVHPSHMVLSKAPGNTVIQFDVAEFTTGTKVQLRTRLYGVLWVQGEGLILEASVASQQEDHAAIVVVEDDDDIRSAVEEILHDEGYSTVGMTNGEEALRFLRSSDRPPRLILLDLMMPVMDGWEFLMRIDEEPDLHRIPVVIMSAHPSIRRAFERYRGKNFAAQLLLPKPLNLLRLLSIVRSLCGDRSSS